MEVDWQVVDQGKILARSQQGQSRCRPDPALLEQTRHEQRTFVNVPLVDDEDNGQDKQTDERADYVAVTPRLADSASLHGQ